jgi:hypothetical protein
MQDRAIHSERISVKKGYLACLGFKISLWHNLFSNKNEFTNIIGVSKERFKSKFLHDRFYYFFLSLVQYNKHFLQKCRFSLSEGSATDSISLTWPCVNLHFHTLQKLAMLSEQTAERQAWLGYQISGRCFRLHSSQSKLCAYRMHQHSGAAPGRRDHSISSAGQERMESSGKGHLQRQDAASQGEKTSRAFFPLDNVLICSLICHFTSRSCVPGVWASPCSPQLRWLLGYPSHGLLGHPINTATYPQCVQ